MTHDIDIYICFILPRYGHVCCFNIVSFNNSATNFDRSWRDSRKRLRKVPCTVVFGCVFFETNWTVIISPWKPPKKPFLLVDGFFPKGYSGMYTIVPIVLPPKKWEMETLQPFTFTKNAANQFTAQLLNWITRLEGDSGWDPSRYPDGFCRSVMISGAHLASKIGVVFSFHLDKGGRNPVTRQGFLLLPHVVYDIEDLKSHDILKPRGFGRV